MTVTPDSDVRPLYSKVPFPIDFRVYIFNITNKEEVQSGGIWSMSD